MRVNLVYDPERASLNNKTSGTKDQMISGASQDLFNTDALMPPPSLGKAMSHHPAFLQLADQSKNPNYDSDNAGGFSKVYLKRNFLYSELS